jgi:hypothetical protein
VDASGTADETSDIVIVADTGAVATAADAYTSIEAGVVTGVDPEAGQSGTTVTIIGTAMFGGGDDVVTVTLAGATATIGTDPTETEIVVTAEDSDSEGAGDVVIVSDSGAIVTLEDGFTYVAAGSIDEISPASGQVGTRVTILGSNMLAGGTELVSVKLAGVEVAEITSSSDDKVEVIAAASLFAEGEIIFVSDTGAITIKPYDATCGE